MAVESRGAALERLRPWVERAAVFSGWSFPGIRSRSLDGALPWSYEDRARELARGATRLLDMDTGGGERLAAIVGAGGAWGAATEEWPPNIPVARERLAPLGIDVVHGASGALPFRAGCFDLVLNRHGALHPGELDRVLRPGGWFVTQQVRDGCGWNWRELDPHFPRRPVAAADQLDGSVETLRSTGYEVDARRAERRVAYPSLGEFVYMLCVTPWTIPDFDVEADLDALLALEADCLTPDGFVVTECRDYLEAQRPL